MHNHNLQSALIAADGIRKMDAIYDEQIEVNEPNLTQVSNALLRVLKELAALIAVNFFKIVFPGSSLERVYGRLILRDEQENDLLSYDEQISNGILYSEKLGVEVNLKEHPEAVIKILPPEVLFYILSYDEKIDINKLIS